MNSTVQHFFDEETFTFSYVLSESATGKCMIIDSVLNFDYGAAKTNTTSADLIIQYVREHNLSVEWILETHVHADHLSAAPYLKQALGGKIGIGADISEIQSTFAKVFNETADFKTDGTQFDCLFKDGDVFMLGELPCTVMHTPGHTPACVSYYVDDKVFVGDTLFMPDFGTARCDFPGGDARTLYRSIQKLLALPANTALYMCHDYKAPGRDEYACETTVARQRENVHLMGEGSEGGSAEDSFVALRTERDAQLSMPKLIFPSVQINMRAGKMPTTEENGQRYLKIPIDMF